MSGRRSRPTTRRTKQNRKPEGQNRRTNRNGNSLNADAADTPDGFSSQPVANRNERPETGNSRSGCFEQRPGRLFRTALDHCGFASSGPRSKSALLSAASALRLLSFWFSQVWRVPSGVRRLRFRARRLTQRPCALDVRRALIAWVSSEYALGGPDKRGVWTIAPLYFAIRTTSFADQSQRLRTSSVAVSRGRR